MNQSDLIEARGFRVFPVNQRKPTFKRPTAPQIKVDHQPHLMDLPREFWKPLPMEFKPIADRHVVSNLGRVKLLDYRDRLGPRIIAPFGNNVTLSDLAGHTCSVQVARLVARAFLGPAPEGHGIRFKNGNRLDCAVENLEYVPFTLKQVTGAVAQAWIEPLIHDKKPRRSRRFDP